MTAAAAGMAHDFRNALQVIGSALDQLEGEVPAVTAADPYADIKRATASAAGLAQRLVDLGRGGPVPQSAIDVGAVVADAVAMARRVVDRSIAIHVDVPAGTFVRGSSDELQQVLLNLCLNARDAMPQGGTIAITASTRTLDRDALSANLLTDEGRYVELTVADNGVGMPPAVLARVFEPFFTTKEPGKGTGLGLAMTHAIVKKHGGAVSADSRVGGGTTIKLLLPCRSPPDG